jgi:DNA-binding YbaB/EbfC family protein
VGAVTDPGQHDDLDGDQDLPGGDALGGLLEQAMALQSQMAAAQAQAQAAEVEGSAGGGMVRVTVTGAMEIRSVRIDPACVDPDDVEMLEDLVTAALRDATTKVAELNEGAMGGIDLGGLGESLGLGGLPDPGELGR